MRIRCVHSNSPVTDLRFKTSVETWRANCNSRRTWTNGFEEIGSIPRSASEIDKCGYSSSRSVSQESRLCATRTTLVASEPERSVCGFALQSDDEITMKVMINGASTLLSLVTTGHAPTEGIGSQETSEWSDRLSFALLSGLRKEGDRHGVTIACTLKDACVNMRRHWRETDSSRCVYRTALRHPVVFTPDVESVETNDERIGDAVKDQELQRSTRRNQKPFAARR